MARKPTSHLRGAFYYVLFRGNKNQPIFFSKEDRYRLCLLIQQGTEYFGYQVYAFAFMRNQIHLIIRIDEKLISEAMQHLFLSYNRYINSKQQTAEALFQSPFDFVRIEDEQVILDLVRYIDLLPFRSGIESRPELFFWTSHRAYLGLEQFLWLQQEHVLLLFDPQESKARMQYADYIKAGIHVSGYPDLIKKTLLNFES